MIFGVDVSKYNAPGTYDPGSFEIFNIEDPGVGQKIDIAKAAGRPWGIYVWIYPGSNVAAFTQWAINSVRQWGEPPLGVWADYEQDGVNLGQLDDFFRTADAMGMKSGYYGNDWRFGHGNYLNRPFWLAGYPGANDGSFPGMVYGASRPVQIWQFTSSNGALDRNVVVDEGWWGTWGGSTAAAQKGDDKVAMYITKKSDQNIGIWVTDGVWKRHVYPDEWAFAQFVSGGTVKVVPLSDEWWDSLPIAAPDYSLTLKDLANVQNIVKTTSGPGGSSGGGSPSPTPVPTKMKVTLTGEAVPE